MRILFWGTPAFALPSLRALGEEGHEVVGVVTRPDRPAGRGRKLTSSPVKEAALEEGYPVLTPERPRGEGFLEEIRGLGPDLSVVVAYGHILLPEVLDVPPRGSVNLHPSLLPRLRGAAPVNWAIIRGHARTGVTIMRMVEAMDAGPILLRVEEPIGEGETASDLSLRLAEVGAETLVEALALMEAGVLDEREQDDAEATYAPRLSRDMARVDWEMGAVEVTNFIRGLDAVPGAWTLLDGEPLKVFRATPGGGGRAGEPGRILVAGPEAGLRVAAGLGTVRIGEVQPPGKRRMSVEAWLRGHRVEEGRLLE